VKLPFRRRPWAGGTATPVHRLGATGRTTTASVSASHPRSCRAGHPARTTAGCFWFRGGRAPVRGRGHPPCPERGRGSGSAQPGRSPTPRLSGPRGHAGARRVFPSSFTLRAEQRQGRAPAAKRCSFRLRPTRFSSLARLPAAPGSALVPGRNAGRVVTIQPRESDGEGTERAPRAAGADGRRRGGGPQRKKNPNHAERAGARRAGSAEPFVLRHRAPLGAACSRKPSASGKRVPPHRGPGQHRRQLPGRRSPVFRRGKRGTGSRGRRQSERRGVPPSCGDAPGPLAASPAAPPAVQLPGGSLVSPGAFNARPKRVLPGPVPGRSPLPPSHLRRPCASFLPRCGPGPAASRAPDRRTPLPVCPPLTAQQLLQFRALPPNRCRGDWGRLAAPGPGARPRCRYGGGRPRRHLAPSRFSYGEILRRRLLG